MIWVSIIAIYLLGLVFLFIEFPKTMITCYVLFMVFMFYMMKTARFDYELWPDLYKKTSLS